ncbi:MAG TPA: ATP-binding protein [Vicinamibacterales bacterium]|nr:ATP-binding protein [Vicinamibacterales bacterium]
MAKKTRRRRTSPAMEDLRRRLQEAEDTIDAIREGHVEALVVSAPDGEQIYTLRTADQPYRLMVEQMREGALTLAADGTILYCNQRFAELMAHPPERIAGRTLGEFLDTEDSEALQRVLTSESSRAEVQLKTATGTLNPAQLSSITLNIDGVRTVAVVVTDLTHERTERGLRESNRLKDEFLATLSHELRTPLNVILGWTRMLLTGQLSESSRQHALELIDRNAQAQAQLVNDLVDMSRMTTGKLQVELEPLPVIPVLEAALESVRPAADAKQLAIHTSWRVRDANVLADATRLQQILWNLLSNAVKFTPNGGRISVSAERVDQQIRIEVADTGIGIDPAFLPHVFDRFRQADSATTRRYGGLGLGLAIVHDLVRLHGGEVDVRSPGVGQGATFAVTFRASHAAAVAAGPSRPSRNAISLKGYSILLLEDHADSRELLVEALRNSGADVAAFAAASDAFAALDRLRPSVIVADIALPDEDGYSFIRRVRAHSTPSIQATPAIAVTAYATMPDRAEALAVGFQQHLPKPIDPARLIQAINELNRRPA